MQNDIASYKGILKYLLFFFYFSAVYQGLCFLFNVSGFVGLRESFFVTFLWLLPVLVFQQYAKIIAALIGFGLWMSSLASLGYFILYQQEFSQSVIFIIFESNIVEGTEYLKAYFVWWSIPVFAIYSYIGFFLWKKLPTINIKLVNKVFLIPALLLVSTQTFAKWYFLENASIEKAFHKQMNNMQSAALWNIVFGYVSYRKDLANMEYLISENSKLPSLNNLTDNNRIDENTLVLVIGESTNRNRMSLYGYERNTTPRLKAMQNELAVFENVYAPRPYTIEVLEQALTFADENNPNLYLTKPNLINIMKQAGYHTYWITNQQTQTTRNTMLTTFSKMCHEQFYLNNNRRQNSSSYDEVVLPPFTEALADKAYKKKFIIVHLLGTHSKYDYRYPDSYSKFSNFKVDNKELDEKQQMSYNSYDNAVYYNDYVVSEIIKSTKVTNTPLSLLYFSDHGEEVFDNNNIKKMGRNEDAPTKAMYTVPFIIYANKEWKQNYNFEKLKDYKNRFYSSSNLLYTYCDLAHIRFDEFDGTKSIINDSYIEYPILIGNPEKKGKLRNILDKPLA
jgi:heptose-I-phosphate ethanolaminephosphotransferase